MSPQVKSFLSMVAFGSIFICVGAVIFLVALDIISVPEEDIHAPRWVLAAVGMVFALAGVMAMVQGLKASMGGHPFIKWAYNGLLLVFMILFAAPFHWIAFAPGEREFSTTTSIPFVSVTTSGGDLGGRLAFGCGAVLMDLILIVIVIQILKGKDLSQQ
jgi:hypothetical protein